jgi:hypothetical protein
MDSAQLNNKNREDDLVFFIRVQYRCNSSWQGTIQWMDGRKTTIFRSALELGNIINDARHKASGNKKNENDFPKWKDKEIVS